MVLTIADSGMEAVERSESPGVSAPVPHRREAQQDRAAAPASLARDRHLARQRVLARRRRVLVGLLATAVLVPALAALAGPVPALVTASLVVAVTLLYLGQLIRLRNREAAHQLAGPVPPDWPEAEELWALLGQPRGAKTLAGAEHREAAPALLDRWAITQVLWAGVGGWLVNVGLSLAECLVGGTSCRRLRLALLRPLTSFLASMHRRGFRTVAVSAAATVAATGLGAAASAAPAPTSLAGAASTPASTYTVQPGDTLWGIAQRFSTTVDSLVEMNGIADPNLIYAGQVLSLPGVTASSGETGATPSTYTVQPGDTLWGIAQRFSTTVDSLVELNGIADPNLIYAGQVLLIGSGEEEGPATATTAPPATTTTPTTTTTTPPVESTAPPATTTTTLPPTTTTTTPPVESTAPPATTTTTLPPTTTTTTPPVESTAPPATTTTTLPSTTTTTTPPVESTPPPATTTTLPSTTTTVGTSPSGGSGNVSSGEMAVLTCIMQKESGGDPSAVNPTSGAGGLFGFLPSTWASLGYTGLPENAPASEQWAAAEQLYAEDGTAPWAGDDCG